MASNSRMIVVPYKKTFDVNLVKPIKTFIESTYTSNIDEYVKSIEALNELRKDALFRTNRHEKLSKQQRYYDQLVAIDSKIPITENQVRVGFKWQDAFEKGGLFGGKSSLCLSSGLFERLCVLFNIGACASDIAASQSLDQEDGLKTAAKLYQLAAAAFNTIKESSLTATRDDCTFDLYPDTLSLLAAIMLGQAQEIFYYKSLQDKMKDNTISKIASQCYEYYSEASRIITTDNFRDNLKTWVPILTSKMHLFQSLSEYHRSLYEESEKNIGVQVARLQKALDSIKIADQKGGKEANLKGQIGVIQAAYDKAKKENDYVFHEKVPDLKTLPAIDKATLAKSTQIKFPISEDFRDLFVNLVPISVHNGLQAFNAKRMEAVNLEIGKLRQATDLLNTALSAWNLPAAIEDASGGDTAPQSLLDKANQVKNKGGINKINSLKSELPNLLRRNQDILNETKNILIEEERSDNELKAQLREKWTRTSSKSLNESLFGEIRQYEQIIEAAVKANHTIEDKYRRHVDSIGLLSRSEYEIVSNLPAANAVAALQNTHIIKDLRRLMGEVEGLKNVREVLESEFKSMDVDGLKAKLVNRLQSNIGIDEHVIIQEEIDFSLAALRKQVKDNIQEQDKLLGFIDKANREFCKEKVVNESSKLREEMLKNLASAYDGFNEILNHLEEGTRFYNDLTPILLKLQNKISDFVFARKTEKEDLMKEIQVNLARPSNTTQRAPERPPPPTTQAPSQASNPPYPTLSSPYYPQMPSAYYPYTFTNNTQPAAPVAPPRKNK